MKSTHIITAISVAIASSLLTLPRTLAEEGGAGHHMPGGMSTLIDLLPTQPGWVIESMYLHYTGDAAASARIPIANRISLGLEATSDALMIGGFYTFEQKLLGAHYSLGAFLPYVWMDVDAQLTIGNLPPAFVNSSTDGLGPVLSYILPVNDSTFVVEARWLAELDTTNRLQGDYFWLKVVYQF